MKFGYNILILIECNDEKIQFRRNMCDFTQISLFILFQFDSSVWKQVIATPYSTHYSAQ